MDYQFFAASKKKPEKNDNEDLIGYANNHFWLLDGATTPTNMDILNNCDTLWLVNKINYYLTVNSFNNDLSLNKLLKLSFQNIQDDFLKEISPDIHKLNNFYVPTSTIALIKINKSHIDYAILGDSTILIKTNSNFIEITDKRLKSIAIKERNAIADLVSTGISYSDPKINTLHKELVQKEQSLLNKDNGYWMASLDPNVANHAITGSYNFEQEVQVSLMSDGLTRAYTHFPICDSWESLLEYIENNGIEHCINQIRKYENNDTHGSKYKRTKKSDDASGLYLKFKK